MASRNGRTPIQDVGRLTYRMGIAVRRALDLIRSGYRVMMDRLRSMPRARGLLCSGPVRAPVVSGPAAGEPSTALAGGMADPDPGVRSFALGTIGEHSGEEATLLVLEALDDPEPSVRCAAAAAAARARIPSAVFSLILMLADPVPRVVREARDAIEKITGRRVGFGPRSDASTRRKKTAELRAWWKGERFARLSTKVDAALKP